MSNEAINWALTSTIKHSSAKFVLVVMANCADSGTWEAWPSVAHLAEATGQDRKTVLENIKRLIALGVISDTGARKGATKQVPIYRLNSTEKGAVKPNSTENGTVPNFPANSPEIPYKESRFSAETVPKTGHGTQRNPQGTIKEPKKNARAKPEPDDAFVLPDWVPALAWDGYIEMRKGKRKPPTAYAIKLVIADLAKLHAKGHDIAGVLNASIKNGWTDVYEPKSSQPARASPPYQTATEKAKSWADRITGKTRHEPERQHSIIDLNDAPA